MLGTAVLLVVGLAIGVTGLLRTGKTDLADQPIIHVPTRESQEPGPIALREEGKLPVPSDLAFFIQPTIRDNLEENVPVVVPATGHAPLPNATLPEITADAPPRNSATPTKPKTDEPRRPIPSPSAAPHAKEPERKTSSSGLVAAKRSESAKARDTFAVIDKHALNAPADAEASLYKLAKYLYGGAKTDRERARGVYRWVTDRIEYDVEALFSGRELDPSAEATWRRRMGVCSGYSSLFVDLCRRCGLQAVVIGGYAKGPTDGRNAMVTKPEHAWSAVRLDGHWWLVDATWGAGGLRGHEFHKEFSDFYFLTPPDQLIFTHLPEDPQWQFRKKALSLADFNRRPAFGPGLFEMGMTADDVEHAIADASFRDPVQTFRVPGTVTSTIAVPIGRYLSRGVDYRFEFYSDDFSSFVFIQNGEFKLFSRDNGIFRAAIRTAAGKLQIAAEPKGSRQGYAVILEYVVE